MPTLYRSTTLLLVCASFALPLLAEADSEEAWNVYWKNGTRIEAEDGTFEIKIGGRIQADFTFITAADDVFVADDGSDLFVDGSEFRRARLFVEGTLYGSVGFKAQYDFASGAAEFRDVWLSFKETPVGEIKIGHFKEPFSLGQLTSSKYVTFIERALPNLFTPGRNLGIGFSGGAEHFNWGAGVFRESDNFGTSLGENRRNLTGRVLWRPTYREEGRRLFHLGLSATTKQTAGIADDAGFRTRFEFHFGPRPADTGVLPNDGEDILGIELAGVRGAFWFSGEYIHPEVDAIIEAVPLDLPAAGPTIQTVEFPGYYVQAGYFLTGEHRTYSTSGGYWNRQKSRSRLGSGEGSGAWELAVRYSETDLTDGPIVGGELRGLTLGLNWYPNSATRMMFNYIRSTLEDVGDVEAAVLRAQIDF